MSVDNPLTILIVEDYSDAAKVVQRVLQVLGHDAHVALNGFTALEMVQSVQPDVILLDLGLPGLSGYDVATRLRDMPNGEHATIVALTGYVGPDFQDRAEQNGFDYYLAKPVEAGKLQDFLDQIALSRLHHAPHEQSDR